MHNQRPNFNNPPVAFHNLPKLYSPNMYQGNQRFSPRNSPYPRSPIFNNHSPNFHPRTSSPYYNGPRGVPRSLNNSDNSEQWSIRANLSYSSDSSSSSQFGDISQLSPFSSPRRNSNPHYQNKNTYFQGKRSFQSSESNDSNPGHSNDIRLYVHKSMLEDPWKELMAEIEEKTSN